MIPTRALPDPDKTRRAVGLLLFLIGVGAGAVLLFGLFIRMPALAGDLGLLRRMGVGAALAFPASLVYLIVPRVLDRYDPEPWYALAGCLVWGGLAAAGFSAVINTAVGAFTGRLFGPAVGDAIGSVVSAPIVEELTKGLGVFGVFYFLRREFDGIVDGVIYASFVAIGFAAVENVIYYARAAETGELASTFLVRGVLSPWVHPVYASMTGIGFGIARETRRPTLRYTAPFIGYGVAVFLHAMWNASAMFAEHLGTRGGLLFFLMLPIWCVFVASFLAMLVLLVRRRGKIIRRFLEDEVALGTLTPEEVALAASAFGLFRARVRYGEPGVELIRTASRLALSKWHSVRAQDQRKRTVSMDLVVPLRQHIAALRAAALRPA